MATSRFSVYSVPKLSPEWVHTPLFHFLTTWPIPLPPGASVSHLQNGDHHGICLVGMVKFVIQLEWHLPYSRHLINVNSFLLAVSTGKRADMIMGKLL